MQVPWTSRSTTLEAQFPRIYAALLHSVSFWWRLVQSLADPWLLTVSNEYFVLLVCTMYCYHSPNSGALYLQSNNLSGALPSDLARLSHLSKFDCYSTCSLSLHRSYPSFLVLSCFYRYITGREKQPCWNSSHGYLRYFQQHLSQLLR